MAITRLLNPKDKMPSKRGIDFGKKRERQFLPYDPAHPKRPPGRLPKVVGTPIMNTIEDDIQTLAAHVTQGDESRTYRFHMENPDRRSGSSRSDDHAGPEPS